MAKEWLKEVGQVVVFIGGALAVLATLFSTVVFSATIGACCVSVLVEGLR